MFGTLGLTVLPLAERELHLSHLAVTIPKQPTGMPRRLKFVMNIETFSLPHHIGLQTINLPSLEAQLKTSSSIDTVDSLCGYSVEDLGLLAALLRRSYVPSQMDVSETSERLTWCQLWSGIQCLPDQLPH